VSACRSIKNYGIAGRGPERKGKESAIGVVFKKDRRCDKLRRIGPLGVLVVEKMNSQKKKSKKKGKRNKRRWGRALIHEKLSPKKEVWHG